MMIKERRIEVPSIFWSRKRGPGEASTSQPKKTAKNTVSPALQVALDISKLKTSLIEQKIHLEQLKQEKSTIETTINEKIRQINTMSELINAREIELHELELQNVN